MPKGLIAVIYILIVDFMVFIINPDLVSALINGKSYAVKEIPGIISLYPTSSDNIKFDSDSGAQYVNNELLLFVKDGVSQSDVEGVIQIYGGSIVGYNTLFNQYQVQLHSDVNQISQLNSLCDNLKTSGLFDEAVPNYATNIQISAFYPNDKEWRGKWSNPASGINWGAEAIRAPEMWGDFDITARPAVNVGIYDGQFYTEHEDLKFKGTFMNSFNPDAPNQINHGSHVAGIAAATFNNGKGIAGVATNVNLYGASVFGLSDGKNDLVTMSELQAGLGYLIGVAQCKVINVSYGCSWRTYEEYIEMVQTEGNNSIPTREEYYQEVNTDARFMRDDPSSVIIEKSLYALINKGYDFLIVKAAGNDNVDPNMPHDAEYDMLACITTQIIKDRIIVVGSTALRNDGSMVIADYSERGSRVDILAPGGGVNRKTGGPDNGILSTVYKKSALFGKNSEIWLSHSYYEEDSGTSMAAPQVTGVAAAMWSVNPSLTGPEVKSILCGTATGDYYYEDTINNPDHYAMVDAYAAVERAASLIPATQLSATQTPGITPTPQPVAEDKDFSIVGSWKSVGAWGFGQAQPGSTVSFDGTHCNFYSPYDTYSFYYQDGQWHLECKNFLFGDITKFTVQVEDNDHIYVDFNDSITELVRTGYASGRQTGNNQGADPYALLSRLQDVYNKKDLNAIIQCYDPTISSTALNLFNMMGVDGQTLASLIPFLGEYVALYGNFDIDQLGSIQLTPISCNTDGNRGTISYKATVTVSGLGTKDIDITDAIVLVNGDWYFALNIQNLL